MATQSVTQNASTRAMIGPRKSRWSKFTGSTVTYVILAVLAILWAIPLLWALDTALKHESQTTTVPVSWFASSGFTWNAFAQSLSSGDLPRWYFNSLFTSVVITVLTVLFASLAGFAFSRIPFRSKNVLFWLILAGIMVPGQILIVPLFTMMQSLGMVNTYWGIILPQLASPVAMFIFKQYFDGIPQELEDAALMDGASRVRIYWQIWMPLAKPAVAAVAIFTFVWSWNNFIWPFLVITGTNMMTIPVGLATVQTSYGIRYAQIMATAILGGLPLLVIFIFFQRQIVQGFVGTGLKG